MKSSLKSLLATFSCLAFVGFAQAQDTGSSAHPHDHSGAPPAAEGQSGPASGEIMGSRMDMSQMQGMMDECMKSHQDGKMCNHQMMKQCKSKMNKNDCKKMMKNMKSSKK